MRSVSLLIVLIEQQQNELKSVQNSCCQNGNLMNLVSGDKWANAARVYIIATLFDQPSRLCLSFIHSLSAFFFSVFTPNSRVPNMHITHCNQCIHYLLKSAFYMAITLLLLFFKANKKKRASLNEEEREKNAEKWRFRYGFCTPLIACTAHDIETVTWNELSVVEWNGE